MGQGVVICGRGGVIWSSCDYLRALWGNGTVKGQGIKDRNRSNMGPYRVYGP